MHDPGTRKSEETELRGHMANCWVHSGGRLILVGLRQLRPASGEEHYVPSQQDWDVLDHLRKQPERALAEYGDEVATPVVGAEHEDCAEDLMLPDPLIIDGIGTPQVGEDFLLPRRIPLTPVPLPAMASSGPTTEVHGKSTRDHPGVDTEPPQKVARRHSDATT
eukprot:2875698-Amphidinium_carterae.1